VSLYDVLGVAATADPAAVRRAYLALARQHHPDLDGGDAARMRAVNHAWSVLGDPERRARYDRSLASPPVSADTAGRPPGPRRGYEPDPRYPAEEGVDDDDLDLDVELGDGPVRVTVALPRWLRLLPMATLGAAVLAAFVGTVVASEPLLALGLMLLVLAFLFFVSAPFVALLAGHRAPPDD
jgi:hypothetical protein